MSGLSVLIPDGEDPLALRVMRSLGKVHGVKIDLLTSDRTPSWRFSRFCRRWHVAAFGLADEGRREELSKVLGKSPVDVLLPVSVAGMEFVASQRNALAGRVALPPLPDVAALRTANDKTALCGLAAAHGVPVPAFLVYPRDVAEAEPLGAEPLERLDYPVVLKPPSKAGGEGCKLFAEARALAAYLAAEAQVGNGSRYLLQSYLKGVDLGLNVLCRDGQVLAYTVQENPLTTSPPFGPAAGVRFVRDERALEVGRRTLAALRWSGVANLDMLRCAADGQTVLLEMNPRYWRTLLGSTYAGVNFPYLACLAALGRPMPATDYRPITYAEKPAALAQMVRMVRGQPTLEGFRLRNTALRAALADPLPTLLDNLRSVLRHGRLVAAGGRRGWWWRGGRERGY